jgi:hypothetical protein
LCAHADSDTWFKPNADRGADSYSNSDLNDHAHCHADRNANSYRNSESFTDAETYPYAKAAPDTGASALTFTR